jgi:hypothetical protein
LKNFGGFPAGGNFYGIIGWKTFQDKFRSEIFGGQRLKLKNSGDFWLGGNSYGIIGWKKIPAKFQSEIFG